MAEHDTPRAEAPPSLKDAGWLKRPETVRVFAALSGDDVETRAVGGAVRDALLGRPVTDIDFATTAVPEKVMALARKAGLKAIPTGIAHGTVTVVADGVSCEITTLRRDIETFGRHAKVAFTTDWSEDAQRRDFTLNALYAGADGTLYDPLGGYEDLLAGRVRFIGDAVARIREDYLRILRFFRFNAYYGKEPLDAAGLSACVKERNGLVQLSAERIATELKRLLVAPRAFEGVEALFDFGLLSDILGSAPRLDRLARLIAIETACDREPNGILRLAALSVFAAEDAPRLAARFKLSNAEQAVLALAADETFDAALPDEAAAKRLLYGIGAERFPLKVLLAWAASGAPADADGWRRALTLPERWQAPAFPLRGPDITALGDFKGPEIGATLRALEQHWIEGGFAEDREQLLARAKELAQT
ncbi:MAG: CCA tRNA nucleotidyltransferase [Methyloceanibacter sp.]|uniref:CCA tRNA nucleotidyltransferase n=1 Tax=Methyloceanibacter sp. TaxID=1965321 RepID=UPI003EE31B55